MAQKQYGNKMTNKNPGKPKSSHTCMKGARRAHSVKASRHHRQQKLVLGPGLPHKRGAKTIDIIWGH